MKKPVVNARPKTTTDQLAELELTLTVLWNVARRWMGQRSKANSVSGLSELDVNILHFLSYRNRWLRVVDLGFALSIDDMHLVTYSLKKLVRARMIESKKTGKEVFYYPTAAGRQHYLDFVDDRRRFVEPAIEVLSPDEDDIADLTSLLRSLIGVYEQAARAAASEKGD